MDNPFEILQNLLLEIQEKLDKLDKKFSKLEKKILELPERNYTVKEVAKILKLTEQSVRKKIELGLIEADTNTKPFLIPHSSIYTENDQLRKFKYYRIANGKPDR